MCAAAAALHAGAICQHFLSPPDASGRRFPPRSPAYRLCSKVRRAAGATVAAEARDRLLLDPSSSTSSTSSTSSSTSTSRLGGSILCGKPRKARDQPLFAQSSCVWTCWQRAARQLGSWALRPTLCGRSLPTATTARCCLTASSRPASCSVLSAAAHFAFSVLDPTVGMHTLQQAVEQLHLGDALRDIADIIVLSLDAPLGAAIEQLRNARFELPDRSPGSNTFTRLDKVLIPLLEAQDSMQIGPFDVLPPHAEREPLAAEHHAPLLLDLTHHNLLHDVSSQLGVQYLSETTGPRPSPYSGFLWTAAGTCRALIWLPCKIRELTRCVVFLVDTGAPSTLLCRNALEAFELENIPALPRVSINGTPMYVTMCPSSSHYRDINILGADYLRFTQSVLTCDYNNLTCEIRPFAPRNSM